MAGLTYDVDMTQSPPRYALVRRPLWYLDQDGAVSGPYTWGQVCGLWERAAVTASARICREGSEDWRALADLVESLEAGTGRGAMRRLHYAVLAAAGGALGIHNFSAGEMWRGLGKVALVAAGAMTWPSDGVHALGWIGLAWLWAMIDAATGGNGEPDLAGRIEDGPPTVSGAAATPPADPGTGWHRSVPQETAVVVILIAAAIAAGLALMWIEMR